MRLRLVIKSFCLGISADKTNNLSISLRQTRSDSLDEFNTLECSPHHHCQLHLHQNLPPPPPLYQVRSPAREEPSSRVLQSASCPKHGQKHYGNHHTPSREADKIKLVSAKIKQQDTKEILKILRERAIFIVSMRMSCYPRLVGKPLPPTQLDSR